MVWDVIYNKLKENNIEVYTPGQHKGDCLSPYVVVRPQDSSQYLEFSTNIIHCEVLCYVPQSQFITLSPFVQSVKGILKTLYPQIKESHYEITGYMDETNKSHMWSVQYQAYQKFFNLQ